MQGSWFGMNFSTIKASGTVNLRQWRMQSLIHKTDGKGDKFLGIK